MEYLCKNGTIVEINEAKGNVYYDMQIDETWSFDPKAWVWVKTKTRSTAKTIDKLLTAWVNPTHIRVDWVPCRIRKFFGKWPRQLQWGMFLYKDDFFPHKNADIPYVTDIIE